MSQATVEGIPYFCTSLKQRNMEVHVGCVRFFNHMIVTSSMEYICLWRAHIQPKVGLWTGQLFPPSELGVEILFEFRLDVVLYYSTKCHCSFNWLAAGTAKGQVYLWDLHQIFAVDWEREEDDDNVVVIVEPMRILSMEQNITVRTVLFSPNGQHLVTTNDSGYIGLWKM
jgi:WD40 repeat protein